jgi:hypothetical protein
MNGGGVRESIFMRAWESWWWMELYDVDWAFSEVFFWEIPFGMMVSRRRETWCSIVVGDEAEFLPFLIIFILLICLLASERL